MHVVKKENNLLILYVAKIDIILKILISCVVIRCVVIRCLYVSDKRNFLNYFKLELRVIKERQFHMKWRKK